MFRNSLLVQKDSHIWFRNKVVTLFDDHDQVRKGGQKARFCAGDPSAHKLMTAALAFEYDYPGDSVYLLRHGAGV